MGYGLTSADGLPFAMEAAGDKIVSFGYMADTNDFYLEMYDIPTNQWEKVALPEEILYLGRSEFYSMAAGTNEIYFSYISLEGANMLGTYHLDTNTWTTTPAQLTGTEALVVYQNRLLAIGGETMIDNGFGELEFSPLNTVSVLNPYTGEIVGSLPNMPGFRSGAKAYVSGDRLTVKQHIQTRCFLMETSGLYVETISSARRTPSLILNKLSIMPSAQPIPA